MCGIIGYVGPRNASKVVLESLGRLEYRGYDSAGIAVMDPELGKTLTIVKSDGKVKDLEEAMELRGMPNGSVAIGHTRWATHGRPSVENAHPHDDCSGDISVIHNGIIENFRTLRTALLKRGHVFTSETDSEVLTHLIEEEFAVVGDLGEAVRRALIQVEGAYAIVAVNAKEPGTLVGARCNAPLVIGKGDGEILISSDVTALLPYTHDVIVLDDHEMVVAREGSCTVSSIETSAVRDAVVEKITWNVEQVEKGGYPHFMLKEIYEQPGALRSALSDRVSEDGSVTLHDLPDSVALHAGSIARIEIVACGSALYAGLMAKYALERFTTIPVGVEVASEFRYYHPHLVPGTVVLALSQSGETADTLAAVQEAKQAGATVVAITNVVGSAIARAADGVILMQAGPEIGVAATKTFVTQQLCSILFALWVARLRGDIGEDVLRSYGMKLLDIPAIAEQTLSLEPRVRAIARRHAHIQSALYIARGMDVTLALEGALKLKELTYVHAEGYPAGELKHGPIALLEKNVPVVAIAAQQHTFQKMVSNIEEVIARDAPVIVVLPDAVEPPAGIPESSLIRFPAIDDFLAPLVAVIPLQLFAYHLAVVRGSNVDQPRNLAKSVTVE